jgi:hypothetical protein
MLSRMGYGPFALAAVGIGTMSSSSAQSKGVEWTYLARP